MLDGPCTPWEFTLPCDAATVTADPALVELAVGGATQLLWALGGRRHGLCPVVLRPCGVRPGGSWPEWGHGYRPVLADGVWLNLCGGANCSGYGIRLDAGPVSAVTQVRLDGAAVPPWAPETGTGWTYSAGLLFRLDDGQPAAWPTRQRLDLPPTEPGTFAVDVSAGLDVDPLGLAAAGVLACELLRGLVGDSSCRLPSSVVALVRQGVSYTFADLSTVLADGRTGLSIPDQWIASVNPGRLQRPPAVYSPDRMPRRG